MKCTLCALTLSLLFIGGIVAAEPLVVLDREIVVSGGTPSWDPEPGLPTDWTSPVDSTAGILYCGDPLYRMGDP